MRNNHFASWLGQMVLGFALFLGGLEAMRIFWGAMWEVAGTGALACIAGFSLMAIAELRERPRRVLRRARAALNLPTQWAVKFDKTVPQGGVLPVAVIRADGVRFVIDIQGYTEAEWNDPLDGECLLVGPRGIKFKNDPVAPLMQAATAWGATAVLWLPEAKYPRNLRQEGCNLLVVMGTARDLKHALRGAEIVPMRHDDLLERTMPLMRRTKPRKLAPMGEPELA